MNAYLRPFPLPPIGAIVRSSEDVVVGNLYGILYEGAAGHHWYEFVLAHSVTPRTMRFVDPTAHKANPRTIRKPDGSVYFNRMGPNDKPEVVEWNPALARHASLVKASSSATYDWYSLSGGVALKKGFILSETAISLIEDLWEVSVPYLMPLITDGPYNCSQDDGLCCT